MTIYEALLKLNEQIYCTKHKATKMKSFQDLMDLIAKPAITCGLVILHQLTVDGILKTNILHAPSGEMISSSIKLVSMQRPDRDEAIMVAKVQAITALLNLHVEITRSEIISVEEVVTTTE